MKKILKIFIMILIIILLLSIVNFFRNRYIVNELREKGKETIENSKQHYISIETNFFGTDTSKTDIYHKDDIYLIKNYQNGVLDTQEWKDYKTNEEKAYFVDSNTEYDFEDGNIESMYSKLTMLELNNISWFLFNIIKTSNECYVIDFSGVEYYYSKETGLLQKSIQKSDYGIISTTYFFAENGVNDSDVIKP